MNIGALISSCKRYRYKLWRIWDDDLPKVLFIMLNPSTADESKDDPTIRRCINYAKSWGYGGLFVGNLYAYRTTDPRELKKIYDPIGDDNYKCLLEMFQKCSAVICAWGNNEPMPIELKKNLSRLHYLELSKTGIPKHPLYLKKDLKPTVWRKDQLNSC